MNEKLFRLAQRKFGQSKWHVTKALTDPELVEAGWRLGAPWRDRSALTDDEWAELQTLVKQYRKKQTPNQKQREGDLLARCPFAGGPLPPLDIDVADGVPSETVEAFRKTIHDLVTPFGLRPKWCKTGGESGGFHGDLWTDQQGPNLLSSLVYAVRQACHGKVPLLSEYKSKDKNERPPCVLDDTILIRDIRTRGITWRLIGAQRDNGAVKMPIDAEPLSASRFTLTTLPTSKSKNGSKFDTARTTKNVPPGSRNPLIFKWACRLCNKKITVEEAEATILFRTQKWEPPCPDADVLEIIRRVFSVYHDDTDPQVLASKVTSKNAWDEFAMRLMGKLARLDPAAYEKKLKAIKKKDPSFRVGKYEAALTKLKCKEGHKDLDAVARHAKQDKRSVGWWLNQGGEWVAYPFNQFKTILEGREIPPASAISQLVDDAWTIVNEPFGAEDLPEKRWNKDSAQLAFIPCEGPHPTWDQIFRVIGRGIDGNVAKDGWCQKAGIETGSDYLRFWAAALVQFPHDRLAYLFFYGEQQCGKSSFHESLKLLFARGKGYALAKNALLSDRGFNGEIAGAILCAVEEVDLSDRRTRAYDQIKDWVTGPLISIHPKGAQPYDLPNVSHWVQCAQDARYCPVFDGDTRITMIPVFKPDDEDQISKSDLMEKCRDEAPAFLHTLKATKVPILLPGERLRVPALASSEKREQQTANLTPLEAWCRQHIDWLTMEDEKLVFEFMSTLETRDRYDWTRSRILRELPPQGRRDRRLVLHLLKLPRPIEGRVGDLLGQMPEEARSEWNATSFGLFLTRVEPALLEAGVALARHHIKDGSFVRVKDAILVTGDR